MAPSLTKVALEVQHARDLLTRTYPNGRLGGVRIDGPLPSPTGSIVQLVVKVKEPAERSFKVRGQIAWARHQTTNGMRESFGVDFLPEDETGRDRLLAFASDRVPVDATRYQERVETDLKVKITHGGILRKETLIDLSEGGAFVKSRLPLPVGSEVTFVLRPPLSIRSITLEGRVAWLRRTGEQRGYGLEFTRASAREAERIRKLLDKLYATRAKE
jgi:type IV pilus assembly protein PilZ